MKRIPLTGFLLMACLLCFSQTPQQKIFSNLNRLGGSFVKIASAKTNNSISSYLDSARIYLSSLESVYESQPYEGLDYTLYQLDNVITVLDTINTKDVTALDTADKADYLSVMARLDTMGRLLMTIDSAKAANYVPAPTLVVSPVEISTQALEESDGGETDTEALAMEDSVVFYEPGIMDSADMVVSNKVKSMALIKVSCCDLGGFFEDLGDAIGGLGKAGESLFKKLNKMSGDKLDDWATKALGTTIRLAGKTIVILNEAAQPVLGVSGKTVALLEKLKEGQDKFTLKVADELSKHTGLSLSKDLQKQYMKYLNANRDVFIEVVKLSHKSLEMTSKVTHTSGKFLEEFGKYLMLSSRGFPKARTLPNQNLNNSKLIGKLDEALLQNLLKQIVKYDYASGSAMSLIASCQSATINFDNTTNTFIVELNNIKIKASHPYSMKIFRSPVVDNVLSGTITIKKIKIQLIPELTKVPVSTIKFTTRIIYLDVKNLLPKLDEVLAWCIQKEALDKASFLFEAGSAVKADVRVPGGQPQQLNFNTKGFTNRFDITPASFFFSYTSSKPNEVPLTPGNNASAAPISLSFNESFLKEILTPLIKDSGGLKLTLDNKLRKANKFDENHNYVHIKELLSVTADKKGFKFDFKVQLELRKVICKKWKLSVGINHLVLYLLPSIEKDDSTWNFNAFLEPVTDEIQLSDVSQRVSRKVFNILKKFKQPIQIGRIRINPVNMGPYEVNSTNLKGVQNLEFKHPFAKGKTLALKAKDIKLEFVNGAWTLGVFYE